MDEEIKKLIENINLNLKSLNENISRLVSLIIKAEEEKIKEEYKKFEFLEPLQKNKGFEKFLLEVLTREKEKHGVEHIINRNANGEITQVLLKGDTEHVAHVFNACNWINKKIAEKQKETKNVPKELM
ncbi:MAG: hypothetical protein ABIL89_08025 [candidate division WOR-3 bacterium]